MRLDELGEYAREIGEVLVLLRQNRLDLNRNATELRDFRRKKRSLLFINAIDRERRKLIYDRKCLHARLELLEADNAEVRQELLELRKHSR